MKHTKVTFKGRSYKNYVVGDLQGELLAADWEQFYETRDPGTGWDLIGDKVRVYLNRVCPQKLFKVKEIREPWVTNKLLEEIKDKDSSLRKTSGLEHRKTGY